MDDNAHHVNGVLDKMALLSEASCYDAVITDDDIDQFTVEMARVWPAEDWTAAATAAKSASTGSGFSTDGVRVIQAIEDAIHVQLVCPETELWDWYRLSCP